MRTGAGMGVPQINPEEDPSTLSAEHQHKLQLLQQHPDVQRLLQVSIWVGLRLQILPFLSIRGQKYCALCQYASRRQ